MDTEYLWNTFLGRIIIRLLASILESKLRYLLWRPEKILEAAGVTNGMNILEIDCGTGYYTIPASSPVEEYGFITAIDV